ncbi:MAG TPA: GNAT family N-acetyltransferase [Candidatus Deferrimicrobium sp.]|nr:GNAT family N-acetyltransferase [Candidatus Deferrimicrobium sp.]
MFEIRPAWEADLEAITEIYNQAVLRTTATMDIAPKSVDDQKKWFDKHNEKVPILVAMHNEVVIGWASLSEYSPRGGYANTAEISIYIHENYHQKGYGKKILQEILKIGRDSGFHSIIARISADSQISLHLFETLGFQYVGTLKEVGRKFDRFLDVVIMQLIFHEAQK